MHEETTNHLLDKYNFAGTIWKEGERIFRKKVKQNGCPDLTIAQWQHQPFSSKILNQIWELFPGFVVWEVWIERNNRVFKDKARTMKEVWETLKTHIQETLKLTHWKDQDLTTNRNEMQILQDWGLRAIPVYTGREEGMFLDRNLHQ